MNPFLSKNKKNSIVIICACVCFYNFKSIEISDIKNSFLTLCKNSDAYYTYSYNDVSYVKYWAGYKRYVSVSNKMVVNTSKGVDNYAFLNLGEYESNHLKSIKVKTLKSDGSVVELDSSLVFKRSSKAKDFSAINYPIPAVEPGDTIETEYVYYENLKEMNLMSYVNLYTSLPSINSQYTISTSADLYVRYKSYNEFPEPKIVSNDSLVYLQFSMDNVKGLVDNEYNCLPCEIPYLYYSLEKKNNVLRTWKDVYNEEFNFLTQPMALDFDRSSYYKRWKRRVIGVAKDSSKQHKFDLLHREILKKFKMQPIQGNEFIKSNGFFLKEERFDPFSIRRFYRQVFEDLGIKYWAVFAREKHSGPIDVHYIRKGEFDHIFFAFENEQGFIEFLYPHENFFMYQIGEIPTSLYNTEAILVKPILKKKQRKKDKFIDRDLKLATVDSVSVKMVNLPGLGVNHNYLHQSISSKVNIENKKTSFRYRFKVSGGLSTETRKFYAMLDQNKEVNDYYNALSKFEGSDTTIQIDSVTNRVQNGERPFSYTVGAEGILNNVVNFVNDSLVSLSINELIKHNIV